MTALPTLPVPSIPIEISSEESQKAECTARRARDASWLYTTAEMLRSSQPWATLKTGRRGERRRRAMEGGIEGGMDGRREGRERK